MRALVFNGELRFDQARNQPLPGPGEALVRVTLAGICGTDLEITRGYKGFLGVPGHEFVGIVEAADDSSWVGERVVGEINCPCRACPTCRRGDGNHCPDRTVLGILGRDGAFAEYCTIPVLNLHRVPSGLADEQAVFVEPLAAALEVTEQVQVGPGDTVVVVGEGRLGLLVAQVLRLAGCAPLLVGKHPEKLVAAAHLGLETLGPTDRTEAAVADVVVDCSGSARGFVLAQRLVRPRGTLILKSTFRSHSAVDLSSLVVNEVTVVGSRCGPFAPALRLLQAERVNVSPLLTSEFPLDDGLAAFARAAEPEVLKVLLRT